MLGLGQLTGYTGEMRTRVKVCCIASLEEARLAVEHGADAIGLVGEMPSGPGSIPNDLIARIAASLPPPVASFLLTNETRAEFIADHVHGTGASTVQIVNLVDDVVSASLAALLPGTRRVQVIHADDESVLDLIPLYAPYVHAFLLDPGRRVQDWSVSAAFVAASPRPVFLAGGLNASTVGDAIRQVRPYAVDVCSGVRRAGHLDASRLRDFVLAVRDADIALHPADPDES